MRKYSKHKRKTIENVWNAIEKTIGNIRNAIAQIRKTIVNHRKHKKTTETQWK